MIFGSLSKKYDVSFHWATQSIATVLPFVISRTSLRETAHPNGCEGEGEAPALGTTVVLIISNHCRVKPIEFQFCFFHLVVCPNNEYKGWGKAGTDEDISFLFQRQVPFFPLLNELLKFLNYFLVWRVQRIHSSIFTSIRDFFFLSLLKKKK